jgi:hypothetical protein
MDKSFSCKSPKYLTEETPIILSESDVISLVPVTCSIRRHDKYLNRYPPRVFGMGAEKR